MPARIGYARVSSQDQNLALQLDALEKAGCDQIFTDYASGADCSRKGYRQALATLKAGDTLIVWRLDRLARSMRELVDTIDGLHQRQIGFQSICEYINLESAFGELIIHLLSAIAHFERRLIQERTIAGIQAAKERGVSFGRKRCIDRQMLNEATSMIDMGMSIGDAAMQIGVGRSTLYRYLKSDDAFCLER